MGRVKKGLDLFNVLSNIPEEIVKEVKIVIKTYSQEYKALDPCETYLIPTGIVIPIFFPMTHTLRFEGVKNSYHLETFNQVISPSGEELKIKIANYSDQYLFVRENMPLGEIIIEPVLG